MVTFISNFHPDQVTCTSLNTKTKTKTKTGTKLKSARDARNAPKKGKKIPTIKKNREYKKVPGAPKRFKSSFIHFYIDFHRSLKGSKNGKLNSIDVSKQAAAMWKTLTPDQRLFWDMRAKADAQRYAKEMENFDGEVVQNVKDIKKKQKKKKDPSAPKRSPSAFLLYSQRRRKQLSMDYPSLPNIEISRMLGNEWRNKTPEEKRPFRKQEEILRAIYLDKKAQWKREEESASNPQESASPSPMLERQYSHDVQSDPQESQASASASPMWERQYSHDVQSDPQESQASASASPMWERQYSYYAQSDPQESQTSASPMLERQYSYYAQPALALWERPYSHDAQSASQESASALPMWEKHYSYEESAHDAKGWMHQS